VHLAYARCGIELWLLSYAVQFSRINCRSPAEHHLITSSRFDASGSFFYPARLLADTISILSQASCRCQAESPSAAGGDHLRQRIGYFSRYCEPSST